MQDAPFNNHIDVFVAVFHFFPLLKAGHSRMKACEVQHNSNRQVPLVLVLRTVSGGLVLGPLLPEH